MRRSYWLDGPARVADFRTTPGDGVDGYAREQVIRSATWFTHAAKGYSHEEAGRHFGKICLSL